ncbi:hypothetical protein [Alkalicoccus daliensis]|uniref:Uncharacterized protein n=1 Tax=Alkalicoccus daliensis TaxID=745820 RepID=A0A1H0K0Y2_9BACI|nr:hypothetical protein [Alkalicoccus daliensis]SDO49509.1 hypothetical protein SAMN04488053_11562 [Alkalicoccus daliensis]
MKNYAETAVWAVAIGIILLGGGQLYFYFENIARTSGDILPRTLFVILFPLFIGILLRIPRLLQEKRADRRWKVQWAKILFIVIPAAYVPAALLFAFLPFEFTLPFTFSFIRLFETNIPSLISLICGYTLAGSFISSRIPNKY